MPRTKTAERAAREAEKKRQRNRSIKSSTKTYIDKAEELIAGGDAEKAKAAVKEAVSQVDKAVKAGIVHANTASHRKSNLMRRLNKAYGTQTLAPRPKKEAKAKKSAPKAKKPAVKKAPAKKKAAVAKKEA